MQKQAPSVIRILIAIGFAVSCFLLFLFLWISFGGPTPLGSKSYRITVYFPEATQLAVESDVRIGGVSVGKVKALELGPPGTRLNGNDTTAAELEIKPEYAPISEDARAILRQKTLLGETYVELTSGTEPAGDAAPISLGAQAATTDAEAANAVPVEEGGSLGVGQTEEATEIDEIFNALDDETRGAFQRWQQSASVAIRGRGADFNDALGNLAPFLTDATDVFEVLERQEVALRGVIRDTGTTFEAISERGDDLTGAIRGGRNTFEALAREEDALAETFAILPTFQRESRATFERLDEFQRNATPLVEALLPVARKLSPTLADVRRLSPELRDLFHDLEDLERVSLRGLPALRDILDGLAPVLNVLDPFLANLNPVIDHLEYQKATVSDFLAGPGNALSGSLEGLPGDPAPRHFLRQLSVTGNETLSIYANRIPTNRGHGYVADGVLNGVQASQNGIFPNFDCVNTDFSPTGLGGDPDEDVILPGQSVPDVNRGNPPDARFAPCYLQDTFDNYGGGRAPQLFADP